MPELRQRNDVESQMLPTKDTSPQATGCRTELFLGNQTGSTPVQSLNDSKKRHSEILRHEMNTTANNNGDDNIPPPQKKQLHKVKSNLWGMILPRNSTCHYPPQLSKNQEKNALCSSGYVKRFNNRCCRRLKSLC